MSQYSHLSERDSGLPLDIPGLFVGPITSDPVPRLRQKYVLDLPEKLELHRPHLPPDSKYTVENHTIAVEDGEICVRTISPMPTKDESPNFPVLVYFHGGGWVVGDLDMKDFALRILSVELRFTIVNVDYSIRLAPEHPFPTGLDDCYAALKWTVGNCMKFSGSLEKGFIVCGASAGANFAAAVTHRSLKDPFFQDHKITGHILQIPALIHPAAYPTEYMNQLLSSQQNKDAPILSKALMDMFYDCLGGPPNSPELSPFVADHAGIPPAYIQVCGLDPLRDEGLLYERLLHEAGVLTKLDIYSGVPHGFPLLSPEISAAKRWEEDFRVGLQWLI